MENETCGILTHHYNLHGTRHSSEGLECLRPEGHAGPHLIQREDGKYIAYETDLFCTCEICSTSNEPEDWCDTYRVITRKEAKLLKSTTEEGIVLVSLNE